MTKLIRKIKKTPIVFYFVFALFCLYALTLLIPFFWAFMNTFKTEIEYITNRAYFPKTLDWTNYIEAFTMLSANGNNMFVMLINSLWWSVALASSTMSAYVVAKYKFFGRGFFYALALVIMMLPIVGALPSQYTVYDALHILNTPGMLITCANGFGFNFIVLFGFFSALPWDYVEAAFLDGAGHFRTMFSVMLPLAMPVICSLGVVSFINMWNDYNTPILFLESFPTLSSGLYLYQTATMQHSVDIPMLFSGVIMSMIPVVTLFCFFQNSIMNLSFNGGLKG